MREAPSRHTHSETPFGPQQQRLDSINAKRSPAIANSGATTESWRRVVKKPQAFLPAANARRGINRREFVRHNRERMNTAGHGWGSLTNDLVPSVQKVTQHNHPIDGNRTGCRLAGRSCCSAHPRNRRASSRGGRDLRQGLAYGKLLGLVAGRGGGTAETT
jgi:hypothetical protein